MQPVCKKVVVHDFLYDKIEKVGLKSKLTLIQGGGGKNLSVNLTLSVQWVGMDGFLKTLHVSEMGLTKSDKVLCSMDMDPARMPSN